MSKHLPADSPTSLDDRINTVPQLENEKDIYSSEHEKKLDDTHSASDAPFVVPEDWIARFIASYEGEHAGETLPPGSDPELTARAVFTKDVDESVSFLKEYLEEMSTDYTLDVAFAQYMRDLVLGPEHCEMDQGDWAYEVCRVAGTCDNWSPYAEVRAVLLPYDDPDVPCETPRAYVLGIFWVTVSTLINTFFFPRQPGISLPGQVVQLLMVPMGRFMAATLPEWEFSLFGTRFSLNPGPWSSKEQLMATLMFNGANGIGNSTGLLAVRAPMFFNQRWAGLGWSILFALANQGFGLGFAGMIRRITVYPVGAVWPNALPTLALNRTLINQENKRERIFGWTLTRWHMFIISSAIFLVYYWIPNNFVQAIRVFNWMTWIAPNNFNLAVITGGYGGMGFNPLSTLDPNTGGAGNTMNAPFFAQLQQYVLRVISGIIILVMYYTNTSWGAYLPINTNGTFDNKMNSYNLTRVLNDDNTLNEEAYLNYSPPYYGSAYIFTQGATMAWFTFSIVYVFVRYRKLLKKAFGGMWTNFRQGRSIYTGYDDGHCRLMRKYPEVPEWWYGIILLVGFVISIVALAAFPTETPWWTVLMVFALGVIMTIAYVTIDSIANTGINQQTVWNVLPGLWFPGKFLPLVMLTMLGDAFGSMASGFGNDLKYGHYARIPPRCIFRTHVLAIVLNVIIYCGTLELLETLYNKDNTFCAQDNANFMVCAGPRGYYSSIIAFGTFGTLNLFKLYPALPWCFLLGAVLAVIWVAAETYAPNLRRRLTSGMNEEEKASFDAKYWSRASSIMQSIHPAIALSGATQWSGNNNLTYATLGVMSAWFFQFFLKRKYTAWWGKYAFMLFAGLAFGITISGFISTLVFSFGAGKGFSFNWSGNTIAHGGIDWDLYLNKASLLPLPAKGYFGLDPDQYPRV